MGKLETQHMKLLEKRVAFLERVVDALMLNGFRGPDGPSHSGGVAVGQDKEHPQEVPQETPEEVIAQWRRRGTVV